VLPNADRATVSEAKVRDYLLSSSHPVGRFKATFFLALGFSADRWELLQTALLFIATTGDASPGQPSPFGQKFEVRATLTGPAGRRADVVTVWMIPAGHDSPQFITAFPA
jgi:hypothetical protein